MLTKTTTVKKINIPLSFKEPEIVLFARGSS